MPEFVFYCERSGDPPHYDFYKEDPRRQSIFRISSGYSEGQMPPTNCEFYNHLAAVGRALEWEPIEVWGFLKDHPGERLTVELPEIRPLSSQSV